jgi:hypothetical protein
MIVVGFFRRQAQSVALDVAGSGCAPAWSGEYSKRRSWNFVPLADAEMAVSSANRKFGISGSGSGCAGLHRASCATSEA